MNRPINRDRRNTLLALIPLIREGSEKGWVQYIGRDRENLLDKIVKLTMVGDKAGAQDWAKKLRYKNACLEYAGLLKDMRNEGIDITEYTWAFSRALGGRAAIVALEFFDLYDVDPFSALTLGGNQTRQTGT